MDRHSPWYKLGEAGGKVVLLGKGYWNNSLIHLAEYLHPDEFPRPVFLNRPVVMRYMDRSRAVCEMPILLHALLWQVGAEATFGEYLNDKYGFYRTRTLRNGAQLVCYEAREQYEAIRREMKGDVTWYDPRFWP
jgi:aminoglycoside N3'-acetyltransferase